MSATATPNREVTQRVALTSADYAQATWRPRNPIPLPDPRPFDLPACLARLRRLTIGPNYYAPYDWNRVFGESLEPAEARFWFLAMTSCDREQRPEAVAAKLQPHDFTRKLTLEEIRHGLREQAGFLSPRVLILLASMLEHTTILDVLLDPELCVVDPTRVSHYFLSAMQTNLLEGYRLFVLPYLDDATIRVLRERARAKIPASLWSQNTVPTTEQFLPYRLAPLLGLHRELQALVSGWADNLFPSQGSYDEWRRMPREMIFGLGDAWLVEQHLRRLKLYLRNSTDARAWLAHTETRGIEFLVQSVRAARPHHAGQLVEGLCLIESPDVARPLLELRLEGIAAPSLRAWFERQIANAVAGLLPVAAGRGKLADAARGYLREVRRRGLGEVIEEQLAQADASIASRVRQTVLALVEPTYPLLDENGPIFWLRHALHRSNLPTQDAMPDWLIEADLEPLVLDGKQASPALVRTILRLARAVTPGHEPPPLFPALTRHAEVANREAFAWRLVEQWQYAGTGTRDGWVLNLVGWLGGDESVLRLTSLIRDWTGHSGRQLSCVALTSLAAIGSPLALQQLSAVARQGKARQVRECARRLFEQTARSHGLTRGELEEQSVPRLGFDGEAGPRFDFGRRQFHAVLAPGMRLLIRDAMGQLRPDLPSPGARDDAGSARQAIAEWRRLRKSFREVSREQAARMEQAMVSGQRWSLRHLRERILGQPLLARMSQLLLWAGYDDRGRVTLLFRVNDEGTFVDAEEAPLTLKDLNSVRIVHPVELSTDDRTRWSEVWRDHELITPFPQLGRRIFIPDEKERLQRQITSYRGRRISALGVAGQLRGRDWQPALLAERRAGEGHVRYFPASGVTAILYHPNVGAYVYPNHRAEQELQSAFFLPGHTDPESIFSLSDSRTLLLGEVPNLVYCEVCEALAALYGKGKE